MASLFGAGNVPLVNPPVEAVVQRIVPMLSRQITEANGRLGCELLEDAGGARSIIKLYA
jgi:hypothetical protein